MTAREPRHELSLRSEIASFSSRSKARLRWTASNASPALISQFGMSYHHRTPSGRECKAELNRLLDVLRKRFGKVGYLWILEFQTRGTVHFHLYLTLDHKTEGLHSFLAESWNRIAEPGDRQHLAVHSHPENFIPWDMGSGAYLCKYLDKVAQKCVPPGFSGVGRFWGASRGLVPPPDEIDADVLGGAAGMVPIVRGLCRHHEASVRRARWKSRARRARTSYRLPNGATVARRLIQGDPE